MDLISERLLQDEKNVIAMEVKEIATNIWWFNLPIIRGSSLRWNKGSCQNRGATNFGEAKHQAKSREMENALYTNSFNVIPTYGVVPPSQPHPSSIQSPMFN